MKWLHLIISVIIIVASAYLSRQIILNSVANQKNKIDYSELNSIKYGLLNISEWKRQVTGVLTSEINKLDLTLKNEQDLKNKIKDVLNTLIFKVEEKIREQSAGSMWGRLKQSIINIFVSLDDIKKGIPEYTEAIFREMTKPEAKSKIKGIMNEQVLKFAGQTYDTQDKSKLKNILSSTGSVDVASARIKLKGEIDFKNDLILRDSLMLIALSVFLFFLAALRRRYFAPSVYISLVVSLLLLLAAGVTTPMIDMEAKISSISFMLIGHPVKFVDQVLYFQTKSIIDVFRIMIKHEDFLMKFVGVLMITFSIVFPLFKIASSMFYYFKIGKAHRNPVIKFFVFKSGKWSMADVMVIAIFMAYIGFNGIIKSQLGYLSWIGRGFGLLTTNGTALQPGYYIFVTYTLLALFLTGFLARNTHAPEYNTDID